ncbi:hypothetical protein GQ457_03G036890 [Hibiscus cannabinus]
MGLAFAVKALLLLQLSLLLPSSYFAVSAPVWPQATPPLIQTVSPLMPPSSPSSHHHHLRPFPPTNPPTPPPKVPTPAPPKPPTDKPPTSIAPKPPTIKPPTNRRPAKPPTKAPTKPPTQPPTKAPTKPPTQPPTKAPTKPPTQPPTTPPTDPPSPPTLLPPYPISNCVAVQGVVYCKSCKYAGNDTVLDAEPILGATVKLACMDSNNNLTAQSMTDNNGYFLLQPPITIINFSLRNCLVSLVSSPVESCSTPSNMNGGLEGAPLKPEKSSVSDKPPYVIYSVGPFAFDPTCP